MNTDSSHSKSQFDGDRSNSELSIISETTAFRRINSGFILDQREAGEEAAETKSLFRLPVGLATDDRAGEYFCQPRGGTGASVTVNIDKGEF